MRKGQYSIDRLKQHHSLKETNQRVNWNSKTKISKPVVKSIRNLIVGCI